MKHINKNIIQLLVLSVLILFMGCTKEVDIQEQFDFDFEIVAPKEGFVAENIPIEIIVKPNRVVNGSSYTLSSKTEKNKFCLESDSTLIVRTDGDKYVMPSLKQTFTFISTEIGTNTIEITVEDNHKIKKTKTVTFVSEYTPFTFLLTPNLSSYTINSPGAFTSTLVRKDVDEFKFEYIVENGSGVFYEEAVEIPIGKPYMLSNGVKTLKYLPTTIGTHHITGTMTAADGAKVTRIIDVVVDNLPFTIAATATSTSITINREVVINVDLTEQLKHLTSTYEITHAFDPSGISGLIKNSSALVVAAGIYSAIKPGTHQYKFSPTSLGTAKITFRIKDANGQVKEAMIEVLVSDVLFSFTGASSENTIFINETTPINFDIAEQSDSDTTYEMKYEVTNGRSLIKNGSITEQTNFWYPVSKGAFNRSFMATAVGPVSVLFTVRNKVTMVQKTATISINVKPSEFSFDATPTSNNQVINSEVNVNFNLTQTGGIKDTYQMRFTSSKTGKFIYKGKTYSPGEIIPFVNGSSNGSYKGISAGAHDISFTVTNQLNTSKNANIALKYINNDFSLSTAGNGTVFVNQLKDINVIVSQLIPDPTIKYNVKFSFEAGSSTNGQLLQNGSPISFGSYTEIKTGNSIYNFKGISAGKVALLIEVQNSNGLIYSASVVLEIKNADFTFTGGANNPTTTVDKESSLTFEVTEPSNSSTSYEMSYKLLSGNALIKNAGISLSPFQWTAVNVGGFTRTITPLTSGDVTLEFSVRNKVTLQIKTVEITVNAYQPPTPINIFTSLDFWDRDNKTKKDEWRWYIYMEFKKNPNATIDSVILEIDGKTYLLNPTEVVKSPHGENFRHEISNSSRRHEFDKKPFILKITDSNKITTTTTVEKWENHEW